MIKITKRPSRLSDGSVVHDLCIAEIKNNNAVGYIELPAMDEVAAYRLMEVLRTAIVNYTTQVPVLHEMELN